MFLCAMKSFSVIDEIMHDIFTCAYSCNRVCMYFCQLVCMCIRVCVLYVCVCLYSGKSL